MCCLELALSLEVKQHHREGVKSLLACAEQADHSQEIFNKQFWILIYNHQD